MPNTATAVKAGVCALCRGPGADAEDVAAVKSLLGSVGLCEEVPENLMDAVGGLSGCGPAYVSAPSHTCLSHVARNVRGDPPFVCVLGELETVHLHGVLLCWGYL